MLCLDPRLETSSTFIATLSLCQLRLSHNASFPWLLLIPNRPSVVELIDLSADERQTLMQEIALVSKVMQTLFIPDKLNIATLGNVVPQLHIHLIVRYKTDPAWPNPVWNTVTSCYEDDKKQELIQKIQAAINIQNIGSIHAS